TLIPAMIPPGTAHIHGVSSVGLPGDAATLVLVGGFTASLLHDFAVRAAPKSTISASTLDRLPFVDDPALRSMILLRTLRVNCVTSAYSDLWECVFSGDFTNDSWTSGGHNYSDRPSLGEVTPHWTATTPLRRATDRRQALLEVDTLVAIALGIDVEELCAIYRTQFPVLLGYDLRALHYDQEGRVVPTSVLTRAQRLPAGDENTSLVGVHPGSGRQYTYARPFKPLDREADMRLAFDELRVRVAERRVDSVHL
ncbi:class I SAM-dependent DNA methyltransferase, partial [Tsukamurella sp. NPDC003166]